MQSIIGVRSIATSDTANDAGLLLIVLKIIQPSRVMIYTIARDTPVNTLEKISYRQLEKIARRVESEGLMVLISG